MKKISPQVDTFQGINNALNPCSAAYRQMQAYDALNSRINESGLWDKSPSRSAASLGNHSVTALPVSHSYCLCHWKCDDNAGNQTVTDNQGNHNGTASANTSGLDTTDQFGTASSAFSLANTYYITVTDDDDFSFTDGDDTSFSLFARIYIDVSDLTEQTIISKLNLKTGDVAAEWFFGVNATNGVRVVLYKSDNTARTRIDSDDAVLTSDGWVSLGMTYDGSGAGTGVTLYVNGVPVDSTVTNAGTYEGMSNTDANVIIGGYLYTDESVVSLIQDKIDNVMVFNTELTSQEMAFLYNSVKDLTNVEDYLYPHFKELTINDSPYIVKYLQYNTSIDVGTNKYAYVADTTLDSNRTIYWWDGTTKASADAFTNNTTARHYDQAGMGRPTQVTELTVTYDDDGGAAPNFQLNGSNGDFTGVAVGDLVWITNTGAGTHLTAGFYTVGTIDATNAAYVCLTEDPSDNNDDTGVTIKIGGVFPIADNIYSTYGGRQERGLYYYMYTYYDTELEAESLPSAIIDHTVSSYTSGDNTTLFPTITIGPLANHDPSSGFGRYDTNTKVRIYRTLRTRPLSSVYNSPTDFYFLAELDYKAYLTGKTFDYTGNGNGECNIAGGSGAFTSISVGDWVYVEGDGTNVPSAAYQVASTDSDTYINLTDDGNLAGDDTVQVILMCHADKAHDTELVDLYEGRGSPPPDDVDCLCAYDNRMFYFVDNTVYWSSAGRPDEVAQEYTLNFAGTYTSSVTKKPFLSTGDYAEAKYEISELSGKSVVAAYPMKGKLWVWTDSATGYLETTMATEGIRYNLVRKGMGIVSEKTLAHTPYGLFGADREGVWMIDSSERVGRLSKNIIDISTSTGSTYVKQGQIQHSFGVWSPEMSEYLWCAVNAGETVLHRQIGFQPMRGVFASIYAYPSLNGGCSIYTTGGSQSYTTGGYAFDITSFEELEQTLKFWMGQHSLESIKNNIEIEAIFESITSSKEVDLDVYLNNIASTTGAVTHLNTTITSTNLVGTSKPTASGRMFLIHITIPSDCQAPLIAINYQCNLVPWNEKHGR